VATLIYIFLATWPLYAERNIIDFGQGMPAIDILRPFVLLLVLLTCFSLLSRRKKMIVGGIISTGLIFAIYFLFSLFINETGRGTTAAVVDLFQKFILPLSVFFVLINNRWRLDPKKVSYAILMSGIYVAGVGLLEFIVGHNVVGDVGFVDPSSKLFRTNGPFFDGIGFAGIVLSMVPFGYYALKKRLVRKSFAIFCIVFFALGCLINFSRVIWLGLSMVLVIILMNNSVRGVLVSFYCLMLLVVAGYLFSDMITSTTIFKKRFADTRNVKARYNQYIDAIGLFIDNPMFGMGYDMYRKTHPLYLHNSYLRTLVEFGIFGLAAFCLYIFTMLFNGFKKTFLNDGIYGLKTRLSLIVIVLLVPNTVDFLYNANFQFFLAIMISVLTVSNMSKAPDKAHSDINPAKN
jgi:O-antigen ligase